MDSKMQMIFKNISGLNTEETKRCTVCIIKIYKSVEQTWEITHTDTINWFSRKIKD